MTQVARDDEPVAVRLRDLLPFAIAAGVLPAIITAVALISYFTDALKICHQERVENTATVVKVCSAWTADPLLLGIALLIGVLPLAILLLPFMRKISIGPLGVEPRAMRQRLETLEKTVEAKSLPDKVERKPVPAEMAGSFTMNAVIAPANGSEMSEPEAEIATSALIRPGISRERSEAEKRLRNAWATLEPYVHEADNASALTARTAALRLWRGQFDFEIAGVRSAREVLDEAPQNLSDDDVRKAAQAALDLRNLMEAYFKAMGGAPPG